MSTVSRRMETLLAVVASLLFWRTALVTLVAIAAAVTAATLVPWFTGAHGLGVVLAAFAVGLLWETHSRPNAVAPSAPATTDLSPLVATLALAFFGAVAGGWASAIAGSALFGSLVLVGAAAATALYAARVKSGPFAWRSFLHSACAMLSGLGCLLVLSSLRA